MTKYCCSEFGKAVGYDAFCYYKADEDSYHSISKKQLYPNSKILSKYTGFSRPYSADSYDGYYTNSEVLFPIYNKNDRLGLKEVVVGLENRGQYKAYKVQEIEDRKIIKDNISNKSGYTFKNA